MNPISEMKDGEKQKIPGAVVRRTSRIGQTTLSLINGDLFHWKLQNVLCMTLVVVQHGSRYPVVT